MSYCVNCGVELDASAKICPLCNTPVINPKVLEQAAKENYREPETPSRRKRGRWKQ